MFTGTLLQSAKDALAILGTSPILDDAYLAGGSALALHLGHRKSYDFDFYTPSSLRAEDIASQLSRLGIFTTTLLMPPHTLLGEFNGIKFSLFRYAYPMIQPLSAFQNIKIASLPDIAAMKLSAIGGRAVKRDYVDLYVLSHRHTFDEMFAWYEEKFGVLGNNLYVIIKALNYFDDAENDTMPEMVVSLTWDQVKEYLSSEAIRLARKYLEDKQKR